MQVQKEVGQHHHHPISTVGRHRVTKNAFPDLIFCDLFGD
jgi:hypothetical protein